MNGVDAFRCAALALTMFFVWLFGYYLGFRNGQTAVSNVPKTDTQNEIKE